MRDHEWHVLETRSPTKDLIASIHANIEDVKGITGVSAHVTSMWSNLAVMPSMARLRVTRTRVPSRRRPQ